jgi:hypothetical protein
MNWGIQYIVFAELRVMRDSSLEVHRLAFRVIFVLSKGTGSDWECGRQQIQLRRGGKLKTWPRVNLEHESDRLLTIADGG